MALQVTNENGLFMFNTQERRWLCLTRKRGSFMANCFVPLEYGGVLTNEARANGATDEDFGIVKEKPKKARSKARTRTRKPKVQGEILWEF